MKRAEKYQGGGQVTDPQQQPVNLEPIKLDGPIRSEAGFENFNDNTVFTEEIPLEYSPSSWNIGDVDSTTYNNRQGGDDINTQLQQIGLELARVGKVKNIDGEFEDFRDGNYENGEFDNASWYDKLMGVDTDDKLLRRTTNVTDSFYADLNKTNPGDKHDWDTIAWGDMSSAEGIQKTREKDNQVLFFHGVQRYLQDGTYKQNGFYPVFDKETEEWVLQETELDEKNFYDLQGALLNPYGAKVARKGGIASSVDAFSDTFSSLSSSILDFAEMTGDLYEWATVGEAQEGETDRVAADYRFGQEFNKLQKSAAANTDSMFANGEALADGIGSGLASLVQFWGLGGAIAKGVGAVSLRAAKLFSVANSPKIASMIGHLGGGMVINSGEVYKQAKRDGIDEEEAAALALATGFINSLIEYGVGTNALANKAMGTGGGRTISKTILDYAKKSGMKVSDMKFLDRATGPILNRVFKALEATGNTTKGIGGRLLRSAGSGLEEATEEFIQGHVVYGAKQTYNMLAGEGKDYGKGKFQWEKYDMGNHLEEAALGAILGGGSRFVTNHTADRTMMQYISNGKSKDVLNQIDALEAQEALSKYQANKLRKRVSDLNGLWQENAVQYSYLGPKGQALAGGLLMYEQSNRDTADKTARTRARIISNENLTEAQKEQKLLELDMKETYNNNNNNFINDVLKSLADPEQVKEFDLENLSGTVLRGARGLLRDKSISEQHIKYIQQKQAEMLDNRSNAVRELRKALGIKETDSSKVNDEQYEKDLAEQAQKEIEKQEAKLKKINRNLKDLVYDPAKRATFEESVKENIKKNEDKETENETPPSEKKTTKERVKEAAKKAKEAVTNPVKTVKDSEAANILAEEKRIQEEANTQAIAEQETFDQNYGQVNEQLPSHVKSKTGKTYEVVQQFMKNGKLYYEVKSQEAGKPNRQMPASEVASKLFPDDGTRHRDNFQTTYWLQAAGLNNTQREQLAKLILNDPDLINNLQIEFINIKRELNPKTSIKETNMDINMNGSYLRIKDARTGDLLSVVRTPNRFYDKQGKLIDGDQMTEEFFYNNMQKSSMFTDDQFEEFKQGYLQLKSMIEALEKAYPNATDGEPVILNPELYSFNTDAGLNSIKEGVQKRYKITENDDHTYDGAYRIYDRKQGKTIIGEDIAADHTATLPDFDGRYFALVKRGNVVKWVRIMPSTVAFEPVQQRINKINETISKLNDPNSKEAKAYNNKDRGARAQYTKALNSKLALFVALGKGIDFNIKVERYQGKFVLNSYVNHNTKKKALVKNIPTLTGQNLESIMTQINIGLAPFGLELTKESFREFVPEDGTPTPEMFDSTIVGGSSGFYNPTLSITPNLEGLHALDAGETVESEVSEAPAQQTSEVNAAPVEGEGPIVISKEDFNQGVDDAKTLTTNKDVYTPEELKKLLDDEFGGQLSALPSERLNSELHKDIVRQVVAQYQAGLGLEAVLNFTNEIPLDELELATVLDKYIAGLTVASFIPDAQSITAAEVETIKQKARQALKAKVILESSEIVKQNIINDALKQLRFTAEATEDQLAEEENIADEDKEMFRRFDVSFTELGGVKSLPTRIKQFLSYIIMPETDFFGRTKWEGKLHGNNVKTIIRKTMDGHTLSGHLMKLLSNQSTEADMIKRLEAVAQYESIEAAVLGAINAKGNEDLKTQFLNAFNKFSVDYLRFITGSKRNFFFVNPVESSGANQIFRRWKGKTNRKVLNQEIAKISKRLGQDGFTQAGVDAIVKSFAKAGWDVTPAFAAYLLGDTKLREAFPELLPDGLDSEGYLTDLLGDQDIFDISKGGNVRSRKVMELANIAQAFDMSTYEANYRDSKGKSHYRYVSKNLYLETIAKLAAEGAQDSNPNNVLNNDEVLSNLTVAFAGDVSIGDTEVNGNGQTVPTKSAATNKQLSDKQRLMLMYSLFMNEDIEGYGYFIPHVIESKSSLYSVRLPIKNYYDGVTGITEEAIKDAYGLLLSEFKRNQDPNTQLKTKGGKTQYFGILSILNDATLADGTNVVDYLKSRKNATAAFETKMKEEVIQPMLQKVVADLETRTEQVGLTQELDKLTPSGKDTDMSVKDKIGQLAINHLINSASFTQLFHGDSNFVNDIDFNKRLAGFHASGDIKGRMEYKYLMYPDSNVTFQGVEAASNDAQVLMTQEMYAFRELQSGNFNSTTQKRAYEKLVQRLDDPSIELTPQEINSLDLNSTKTVYEDGDRYFKKSDNIITQEEAEAHPELGKIYDMLNANRIMYLIPESASKRKSDKMIEGFDTTIDEGLIHTGEMQFERDQVINKTKSKKGRETESVLAKQVHDLFGSMLTESSSRELVDNINNANADQKKIFLEAVQSLLQPENNQAFKDMVYSMNENTRGPEVLELLQLSEDGKTYNYNLPHIQPIIEQTMISLYNKGVLRSNVAGGIATLASGTHYLNPQTGEPLKIHRLNNGVVEFAEVLVSKKFFNLTKFDNIEDIPDRLLTAFAARIPTQTYHSMLPIKVVGFLPDSKGDTMVTPLELPSLAGSDYDLDKLFLHRYASTVVSGNQVVTPANNAEATEAYWAQQPLIKSMRRSYKDEEGNAISVKEAMKRLNIGATANPAVLQNDMLDNMLDIFSQPEIAEMMFTPATEGVAQDVIDKYNFDFTKGSIFTVVGNLDFNLANKIGEANIGIAANLNALVSMLTQMKYKPEIGFEIDGVNYNSFEPIYEDDVDLKTGLNVKEGARSKFDSISSLITLFVDNVKLGIAPKLNLDDDMTSIAGHIIGLAAGQSRAFMFVNQPILKEYSRLKSLQSDLDTLSLTKKKKRQGNIRKTLLEKLNAFDFDAVALTTEALDKALTAEYNITDLLKRKELTQDERDFLAVQKLVMQNANSILAWTGVTGLNATGLLATTRGVKDKGALNRIRSSFAEDDKSPETSKLLTQILSNHQVYQNNSNAMNYLAGSLADNFLSPSVIYDTFVKEYGEISSSDLAATIQQIENLKKDPKYNYNIALHSLLQIQTNDQGKKILVADSFTKMSNEVSAQLMGQLEDLFEDNSTLSDNLLKYLMSSSMLQFTANSFVRYMPASSFKRFSDALDRTVQLKEVQTEEEIKALQTAYTKAKKQSTTYQGESLPEQQVEQDRTPVFAAGNYTVAQMKDELGVKTEEMSNLFDKIKETKVVYSPGGQTYYSSKLNTIVLGDLNKTKFLEEALHAGLALLPKGEQKQLRLDVIKWYDNLVENHKGDEKAQRIQKLFNQYLKVYKDRPNPTELAAEELITNLLYKDKKLIQDLNDLMSPNEQGILESMWSKFVKLLANIFGIDIKQGSELEQLAKILQPVDKLIGADGFQYGSSASNELMYALSDGTLFDDIALKVDANAIANLASGDPTVYIDFSGRLIPNQDAVVNITNGSKDFGKAVITRKTPINNINDLSTISKEKLAKELGYNSFTDMKKQAKGKLADFIFKSSQATIVRLEPFIANSTEQIESMNTVDPYNNLLNNVLIILENQLAQTKQNIKNTTFVKNRQARLAKQIAEIKAAKDVFVSVDSFYEEVKEANDLLDLFLANDKRELKERIEGFNKYRILLNSFTFLDELPGALIKQIEAGELKDDKDNRSKVSKLNDSVALLNKLRTKLQDEYIPVLAEKLYPFVKESGPATKEYVDIQLEYINKQREKIKASSKTQKEKTKMLGVLNNRVEKLKLLVGQAPQSEEAFARALRYSLQDDSYFMYLLTSPSTSSDPTLAGLINMNHQLNDQQRMKMLTVHNRLQDAYDTLIEGKSIGNDVSKIYEPIIELKNNRTTGNKDVWTLVTKYDDTSFDKAQEKAESELKASLLDLRIDYLAKIEQDITKVENKLAQFDQLENKESVSFVINSLENNLKRLQTIKVNGPTEKELVRFGLRRSGWFKNNTEAKSIEEIQSAARKAGGDVKAWALTQMNAQAALENRFINQEEFDAISAVEKANSKFKGKSSASYFGYMVTRPNKSYINKKWNSLYDSNDAPKNQDGQAHQQFTEIYNESLALVYKKQSVNMALPSIRKGTLDRVLEKGTLSEIKEAYSRLFNVDQDDAMAYGIAALDKQSEQYAPVMFMDDINSNDVSLDVMTSLSMFSNGALTAEKNNELLQIAYLLQDTFANRQVQDPKKLNKTALAKFGKKRSEIKEGESIIEKRLEKYIEMVLLGKTKKIEKVTVGTKDIQVDKIVDTILGYTAVTTLGLDFLKGTRNYLTASFQQLFESGASRGNSALINASQFADGHKEMMTRIKDLYDDKYNKLGNRSFIGQMLIKFDGIQGNFEDLVGKQVSGRSAMRQFLSSDTLLINYHIGEVAAQGGAMVAHLKNKEVILDGKKYNLYNAFYVNPNTGQLELVGGTEAEQAEAQKLVTKTIAEIREMNRRLNGNYRRMDKSVLSQSTGGRMLELFRKFLVPTLLNRYRTQFVNHETNQVDGGFYRWFINNMMDNWRTSTEASTLEKLKDTYKRSTVTAKDKEKAFRALYEVGTLMILSTLVGILTQMVEDDDDEIPTSAYYLLYLMTTLKGEINAFAPTPGAVSDLLRILRSPTAMTNSILRAEKLIAQLSDPFAEYKRDSGVWKKGESKFKVRLLQSLGYSGGVQFDPETAWKNFTKLTN